MTNIDSGERIIGENQVKSGKKGKNFGGQEPILLENGAEEGGHPFLPKNSPGQSISHSEHCAS